ncbi:hypothetical protein SH611_22445 [Geminicoccaceae bacterium 1502E]|nr:hypothetical protein [Geminicoccaceae bacterium 1502E]
MSWVLFGALVILCAGTVFSALRHPARFYFYPVLAALTMLGWVVPQLLVLLDYSGLPPSALPLTLAMMLLSFVAILLGWRRRVLIPARNEFEYDYKRLLMGAAALTVFGAYFQIGLRSLPPELLEMTQWSGIATVYKFFANTQMLAFAFAWLVFLRTRSRFALVVAALNFLFFTEAILIGGRRGVTVEVGVILAGGLWFIRRWTPPRAALLTGVAVAAILFNAIGEYRAATNAGQRFTQGISLNEAWRNVTEIDFLDAARPNEQNPRNLEVYNAVMNVAGSQEIMRFSLFSVYWNRIVFAYVPAQFLGESFKRSLMLPTTEPAYDAFSHIPYTGTTPTGFSDAFQSFWFFGALVFFGFSRLMRICYDHATRGEFVFQYLYLVLMKDALHAITHSTSWFVSSWVYIALFSLPVLMFAAKGRRVGAVGGPRSQEFYRSRHANGVYEMEAAAASSSRDASP